MKTETTTISLRDGSKLSVRPVAPDDKRLLQAGFDKLGDEARYRRFFTSKAGLTDADLRSMTEIDRLDGEHILAFDGPTLVGSASYARDPQRRHVAEVAVVVAEGWHRRGIATALLRGLARAARSHGIRRFEAWVLVSNHPALKLLRSIHGRPATGQVAEEIQVEVDLSKLRGGRVRATGKRIGAGACRRWRSARRAVHRTRAAENPSRRRIG
jgi:GNAT superfamily N-acetyltransferase